MRKDSVILNLFLSLIIVIIWIAYLPSGYAAEINVPDDQSTIQDAINAANDGDVIILEPGTYMENINLSGKAITLKGMNIDDPNIIASTIIDGNQIMSVVTFNNGEDRETQLCGITIRNGEATSGGGILCSSSSPTISNCIIIGNKASGEGTITGGGIACYDNSSPIIANCKIIKNSATGRSYFGEVVSGFFLIMHGIGTGGGVYCKNSSPTIKDCHIAENSVYGYFTDSSGGSGGGIYCDSSSPIITNCIIARNSTDSWGGYGSMLDPNTYGRSYSYGSGIYCDSSSPIITNCDVADNSAINRVPSSISDPNGFAFKYNDTDGIGGGIACQNSSSPVVTNSILWGDSPDEIYIEQSTPVFNYCSIQGGYIETGKGNIDANPLFIDPNTGDYHLQADSPLDDDCDEMMDEEGAKGCTFYYKDEDQDGFGVSGDTRCLCNPDYTDKYTATQDGDPDDMDSRIPCIEVALDLPKGWSMFSLPVLPANPVFYTLFPEGVIAYGYEKGVGYVRVKNEDKLEAGKGYWILLEQEKGYTLSGLPIYEHNLSINGDGWHMIGGCTCPSRASIDSGNIRIIYGYLQGVGYQRILESENLKTGQGYWILLSDIDDQTGLKVSGYRDAYGLNYSIYKWLSDPEDYINPELSMLIRSEGYFRIDVYLRGSDGKSHWISYKNDPAASGDGGPIPEGSGWYLYTLGWAGNIGYPLPWIEVVRNLNDDLSTALPGVQFEQIIGFILCGTLDIQNMGLFQSVRDAENLTARPGLSSVLLSWTLGDPNKSNETRIYVENDLRATLNPVSDKYDYQQEITGLTTGTTYEFKVVQVLGGYKSKGVSIQAAPMQYKASFTFDNQADLDEWSLLPYMGSSIEFIVKYDSGVQSNVMYLNPAGDYPDRNYAAKKDIEVVDVTGMSCRIKTNTNFVIWLGVEDTSGDQCLLGLIPGGTPGTHSEPRYITFVNYVYYFLGPGWTDGKWHLLDENLDDVMNSIFSRETDKVNSIYFGGRIYVDDVSIY